MKLKNWLVVGVAALAAVAVAQLIVNHKVVGLGVVTNEHGRKAEFAIEIIQGTHNNQEFLRGMFKLSTRIEHKQITLRLHHPEHATWEPKAMSFSGPAVLSVRQGNRVHNIHGRMEAAAHDLKRPHAAGPANDQLKVWFFPREGSDTFTFAGGVTRGDIAILHRK